MSCLNWLFKITCHTYILNSLSRWPSRPFSWRLIVTRGRSGRAATPIRDGPRQDSSVYIYIYINLQSEERMNWNPQGCFICPRWAGRGRWKEMEEALTLISAPPENRRSFRASALSFIIIIFFIKKKSNHFEYLQNLRVEFLRWNKKITKKKIYICILKKFLEEKSKQNKNRRLRACSCFGRRFDALIGWLTRLSLGGDQGLSASGELDDSGSSWFWKCLVCLFGACGWWDHQPLHWKVWSVENRPTNRRTILLLLSSLGIHTHANTHHTYCTGQRARNNRSRGDTGNAIAELAIASILGILLFKWLSFFSLLSTLNFQTARLQRQLFFFFSCIDLLLPLSSISHLFL